MKSNTGIIISLVVSLLVVGASVTIWYLSSTAEFTRKALPAPARTAPRTPANPGR